MIKCLLCLVVVIVGYYVSTNHLVLAMVIGLPASAILGWSIMDLVAYQLLNAANHDRRLKHPKKPKPNRVDID